METQRQPLLLAWGRAFCPDFCDLFVLDEIKHVSGELHRLNKAHVVVQMHPITASNLGQIASKMHREE